VSFKKVITLFVLSEKVVFRIYRLSISKLKAFEVSKRINKNCVTDFMKFEPNELWQNKDKFIKESFMQAGKLYDQLLFFKR